MLLLKNCGFGVGRFRNDGAKCSATNSSACKSFVLLRPILLILASTKDYFITLFF